MYIFTTWQWIGLHTVVIVSPLPSGTSKFVKTPANFSFSSFNTYVHNILYSLSLTHSLQLDSYTMEHLGPLRFSSSELVVVPDNITLISFSGIRLRYTVNLNTSSVGALPNGNFDINELSQIIHCVRDIIPDRNSTRALRTLFEMDGNGDTVGFMRSGTLYNYVRWMLSVKLQSFLVYHSSWMPTFRMYLLTQRKRN